MWNTIQCAIQGRGHIESNTPCQDKTFSEHGNNVYAISLADGAGSASLSHFGAESATKFICLDMIQNFDVYYNNQNGVEVKQILIEKLLENIKNKSAELQCDITELASTLLFVAIKNNKFILGHIGDGVIGYLKNDELKVASHPENGEFTNTTFFTTSHNAIATMKLIKGSLNDITGFVLMSDGTETSLYNKSTGKIADITKKIMTLSNYIPKENVQRLTENSFNSVIINQTTDDCSLIAISKSTTNFNGYNSLPDSAKKSLLELKSDTPKRIMTRYDYIINALSVPVSANTLAKKVHLKPKFVNKYLFHLLKLNFIENQNGLYKTVLNLQ